MRRLYWLASYPRSGNTWLRYLIANAFFGNFEQPRDVARIVPDADNAALDTETLPQPAAFIKTHRQYAPDLHDGIKAAGSVYLIRNPVAVLQSTLRYAVMTGHSRPEAHQTLSHDGTVRQWVQRYLADEGWPRGLQTGFGSWRSNVVSWAIDDAPGPRLVLRYEDVVADTKTALRRIADLIGCEVSDARLERAIAISSAERLMALEDAQQPGEPPSLFASASVERKRALGLRFIRSAEVPGATSLALTAEEIAAARGKFADLMAHFGYQ